MLKLLIFVTIALPVLTSSECTLPQKNLVAKDLEQLSSNCTHITGNIVIDGTNGTDINYSMLDNRLSDVEILDGCVCIRNTYFNSMNFLGSLKTINCTDEGELTAALEISSNGLMTRFGMDNIENIRMASNDSSVYTVNIESNTQLCIMENMFWKFNQTGRFKHDIMICNMPATMCYSRPAFTQPSQLPSTCEILISPLILSNLSKLSTSDQDRLDRIKTVMSFIILSNSTISNFTMENLESIQVTEYNEDYGALSIRSNPYLIDIDFPMLKNIHTPNGTFPIQILNNSALVLNVTQCEDLFSVGFIESMGNELDCDAKYSEGQKDNLDSRSSPFIILSFCIILNALVRMVFF